MTHNAIRYAMQMVENRCNLEKNYRAEFESCRAVVKEALKAQRAEAA